MNKKNVKYEQSRNFCLLLYPDNPAHLEVIPKLCSYRYLAIKHDRGLESDDDAGEDKKVHYHVIIKFENYRSKDKLASDLGIEPNLVRVCMSIDSYMLYMLHLGYENKPQYSINELIGDERLKKRVQKLSKSFGFDEVEKVEKLLDYIEDRQSRTSYSDLVRYALNNGLWDVLKKSQYMFKTILEEHNAEIYHIELISANNPFTSDKKKYS